MTSEESTSNDAGRSGVRRRFSHVPPLTTAIIVVCVAMAILGRMQPQVTAELMFYPPFAFEQPYRFLTSAVLHGGFWHLVVNMYALWLIGRVLEPAFGKLRFITVYILSAIGGNAAIMLMSHLSGEWNIGAVGASGAIFGLFGALAVLYKRVNAKMSGVVSLLVINLVLGFVVPGISWESHLGGLVTGVTLTWAWLHIAERYRGKKTRWRPFFEVLATVVIFLVLVAVGFLIWVR
ncbi:rhomboid family intramembrane serine protease [Trueperella bialowiezensis]|uniref:Rhomboid protease gluP n=1 Tax=Trueperella bialowiezensis TaxID=312285 RepID=A0A448PEJ4_9ACTO|nr:rhomboid family intramembrane serine protease [Trueperella bialowiezensis]VEI13359.1 Rhomboid protease gluP [Trueperella bialowiezensis]